VEVSEPADETQREDGEQPPQRKTRSDKGKPRGGSDKRPHISTRFKRRSDKAQETVRELVRLRLPELDVSELSFAETVERDAEAWGDFLAQLGEWFVPFGTLLDLVFGAALIRVLRMAPSFRAGRRELAARRAERAVEREQEAAEEELRQRIAADHAAAAERGVFGEPEQVRAMTREEWLEGNGNE
jgi:hypothetical protein